MILALALAALTTVSFPVSTHDATAQAAVERGLFLYYAYDGDDAYDAFAGAAARDPSLAMAYWGEALAAGPDLNTPMTQERFARGQAAIAHLKQLEIPTDREGGYVDAMRMRYRGTWDDWASDDAAYRRAMTEFARSSNDENAELLAAEALLEHGSIVWNGDRPATENARAALAFIQDVLARNPQHPMANHLCIHAYDDAPDRTAALPCAQRLDAADLPPQAEHLAHMPAHYWIETGDYEKAVASSERAYRLVVQLAALAQRPLAQMKYASHDVAVAYSAAMMGGNYAAAQPWSSRMTDLFPFSYDMLTALRFGRYEAATAAGLDAYFSDPIRGLADLRLGHLDDAHALAAQLLKIYGTPTRGYVAQLFLARLAEADGKFDEARAWLQRAIDNQHAIYAWEFIPEMPAEEALGGFELRRHDYTGAERAFNDCLHAYPDDPRALFGLAQTLEGEGNAVQAAQARARFDAAWTGADTSLTIDDL